MSSIEQPLRSIQARNYVVDGSWGFRRKSEPTFLKPMRFISSLLNKITTANTQSERSRAIVQRVADPRDARTILANLRAETADNLVDLHIGLQRFQQKVDLSTYKRPNTLQVLKELRAEQKLRRETRAAAVVIEPAPIAAPARQPEFIPGPAVVKPAEPVKRPAPLRLSPFQIFSSNLRERINTHTEAVTTAFLNALRDQATADNFQPPSRRQLEAQISLRSMQPFSDVALQFGVGPFHHSISAAVDKLLRAPEYRGLAFAGV